MLKRSKKTMSLAQLDKHSIGERIALIRKERGFTQQELAKLIGIQRTVLADYEVGRLRLYDKMVVRFAMALHVSTDRILGFEEDDQDNRTPDLRITKRLRQINELSVSDQKALLKNIDMYIKAATQYPQKTNLKKT